MFELCSGSNRRQGFRSTLFIARVLLKEEDKHVIQHVRMLVIIFPILLKLKHIRSLLMCMNKYYLQRVMERKYQTTN